MYIIILASGNSTRFGGSIPKQIYNLNNKLLIQHSIDSILPLNPIKIIIITNDNSLEKIKKLINNQYQSQTIFEIILNPDKNSHRLDSLELGLKYLKSIKCDNDHKIIIHDAARPYVTTSYYQRLLNEIDDMVYIQYCLRINGGLINNKTFEFVDRDDYLEIVTPLIITYNVFQKIYYQYLSKDHNGERNNYEFIPFLKQHNFPFKLITGTHKILRKITTLSDLEDV
jgi:2-C-methyl-D-erythritol 4-phosphate cytidylyltransferase